MGVCRDDDLKDLAMRLRIARAARGMTQAEAADGAGISQAALSLYERAKREPLIGAVKRLALVYGVSGDWLFGLSDTMDPR